MTQPTDTTVTYYRRAHLDDEAGQVVHNFLDVHRAAGGDGEVRLHHWEILTDGTPTVRLVVHIDLCSADGEEHGRVTIHHILQTGG